MRTGIALLVVCGLAAGVSAQSAGDSLEIVRAKARFVQAPRSGEAKHEMKLTLRVAPRRLPEEHVPELHALEIELGGVTLCAAEPGDGGYRVRKNGRWRYRGEAAGGNVTVSGDGRSGKVKLTLRHADLPALRDSPAVDLQLSVKLADTEVGTTATFRVVEHRVRAWRGTVVSFPPRPDPGPDPVPGPGPHPGPDPTPLPSGEALRTLMLADMQTRGVTFFPNGTATPAGGFDAVNLRCPSGALAEVVALAVPLPGSADMFTDTGYLCRRSRQYWAHRTGGFAGVSLWVGPYTLP